MSVWSEQGVTIMVTATAPNTPNGATGYYSGGVRLRLICKVILAVLINPTRHTHGHPKTRNFG